MTTKLAIRRHQDDVLHPYCVRCHSEFLAHGLGLYGFGPPHPPTEREIFFSDMWETANANCLRVCRSSGTFCPLRLALGLGCWELNVGRCFLVVGCGILVVGGWCGVELG